MTLQELREFKKKLLDKYVGSKDKDVRYMMRKIDDLIKRKKVENDN
jgi:hypothetical protein